ncbi:MAG: DNA-directed RNA polymerase subunit beta' [Erythrobacter sp.]
MPGQPFFFAKPASVIDSLAAPPQLDALGPIAGRFIHALRLMAFYDRIGRDPVPELADKLASVDVAAKALILAQAVAASWPENVILKRFGCRYMSHDETTIGAFMDAAVNGDRTRFEAALYGLVRPERSHRLWEGALALVAAEMRAL